MAQIYTVSGTLSNSDYNVYPTIIYWRERNILLFIINLKKKESSAQRTLEKGYIYAESLNHYFKELGLLLWGHWTSMTISLQNLINQANKNVKKGNSN